MIFEDKPNQVQFYDVEVFQDEVLETETEEKDKPKQIKWFDEDKNTLGFTPDLDEHGQIIINEKFKLRTLDKQQIQSFFDQPELKKYQKYSIDYEEKEKFDG